MSPRVYALVFTVYCFMHCQLCFVEQEKMGVRWSEKDEVKEFEVLSPGRTLNPKP